MQIIAVDDEKIALDVLEKAIRRAEPAAEVYSFQKSSEALDYASTHLCEVAFLDIEMRELGGLELAKRLKDANPRMNIVFVTGYSQYMGDALSMYVSGYVIKPATPELVRRELDNLRHPLPVVSKLRARAQTFGNFEFFLDGTPAKFRYAKTKELLAYLVDRRGASCTMGEVCAVLWEGVEDSVSLRNQLRNLISDLTRALRDADSERLLVKRHNCVSIDPQQLDCDFYRFLQRDVAAINAYLGEYMSQYSWAELRVGYLDRKT